MTNLEKIKQMSAQELAEMLVVETIEVDVDYDYDECPFETYNTVYRLPNGDIYDSYDDALAECLQWFDEEVV